MTSPAHQQNIPAPNPTAPATASYASAAGAHRKPAATPVIATGSNLVASGSAAAPAAHHAKSSSATPLNGSKPAAMPAVPAVVAAAPAVVHGSTTLNGSAADHARKDSLTISAKGPSSYVANGGPVGGPRVIPQFGFHESPAIPNSMPQQTASAPIPIPGHPSVPSPANSPSPIPQPSASGGRPPTTIPPDGTGMRFGSIPGDNDRHMKQHMPSLSQNSIQMGSPSSHPRRDSAHSIHNEMANHGGPPPNRGGFQQPGGRGRNYNNNPQYGGGQSMGFPPSAPYPRGAASQGRGGGMPPQFQQRGPMQQYPNSPGRPSPALPHAIPNTQAQHLQNPMNMAGAPSYAAPYFPGPGGFGAPQQPQNYPYPGQYDHRQMAAYPTYGQMQMPHGGYMNPPAQSPSPGFPGPYNAGQFNPPAPQPMSRNPSQVSERPGSSTGQIQAPVIAQGASQPMPPQQKAAPVVSSSLFQKSKGGAVIIKNPQGETVNFMGLKAPASPAPTSKTPPAIVSTPTPPSKPPTPLHSHSRSESTATSKTAEQLRNEFKEQVRKSTETPVEANAAPVDEKPKADEPAKAEEQPAKAVKPAEEVAPKAEAVSKPEAKVDAKVDAKVEALKVEPKTEPKVEPEAVTKTEPKVEPKVESKVEPEPEVKAEPKVEPMTESKADAPVAVAAEEVKQPPAPAEDNDEELERMIREMEEEEARREAAAAEYDAKKKVRDAEAKKLAEAQRIIDAAENDRKLKEQEREMERLEEEREAKRNAAAAPETPSAPEAPKKIEEPTTSDKKDSTPSALDTVAAKLNDLKIGGGADASALASPADPLSGKPGAEKQRMKPSALNLAPLNTKAVEPPQPSAALQSLKTARFIGSHEKIDYPLGINSPNPALNLAVPKKGNFKYDTGFLLQFKSVFIEKPSLDFDQQLKTLIGDGESGARSAVRTPASSSGRQNSRSAVPGFPAMGSFGAAKPLRAAAEPQFAMPGGNMSRPSASLPMASFGRGFPGPNQMSRTPSSSNMGNMPNSPRQGSRSARGGSKRDNYSSKMDSQAAKTMPLTHGQDLKPITVSATGWKPVSVAKMTMAHNPPAGGNPTPSGLMDPPMVQRKVKAALNKMTPEKFDKISDQVLAIALQSKDEEDGRTLRQVIQLTFEKATDESHWAQMYARFCKRMLEMMSPEIRDTTILDRSGNVVNGGALFRKYLLNRCQEEFERGWKTDLPKPKEGESKEAVILSDDYYVAAAAKRRGLGLVQFIGELYKLGMLTERIMHECVRKLVDYQGTPDEAEIESLSKLLRTIGANLDNTEKGKPMMDAYFTRIQNIVDLPELPSRLKFMLMDIIDLRRRNWISNDTNKGPKTLDEVRQEAEAAAAQKAAENARSSQRGPAANRPSMGRGDARLFSNFNQNQPVPNQVGMDDLRRLKGSATRSSSSNVTLGPTSMFASRSNSGRRPMGPGGSLGRAGEDSGASSRTGTPPTRDAASHSNAFHILANMETENPASPPSTAASPALAKAVPDTSGAGGDKKETD